MWLSFYYIDKLTVHTNDHEKAGNDVINILTSQDVENTPLGSFVWVLWVVYFPVKHSCLYNKTLFVTPRSVAESFSSKMYFISTYMTVRIHFTVLVCNIIKINENHHIFYIPFFCTSVASCLIAIVAWYKKREYRECGDFRLSLLCWKPKLWSGL